MFIINDVGRLADYIFLKVEILNFNLGYLLSLRISLFFMNYLAESAEYIFPKVEVKNSNLGYMFSPRINLFFINNVARLVEADEFQEVLVEEEAEEDKEKESSRSVQQKLKNTSLYFYSHQD